MIVAISIVVGALSAISMLAGLALVRSRNEERLYLRYAMREEQVEYSGAANAPILSTDDQYLHPLRPRAQSSPLRRPAYTR